MAQRALVAELGDNSIFPHRRDNRELVPGENNVIGLTNAATAQGLPVRTNIMKIGSLRVEVLHVDGVAYLTDGTCPEPTNDPARDVWISVDEEFFVKYFNVLVMHYQRTFNDKNYELKITRQDMKDCIGLLAADNKESGARVWMDNLRATKKWDGVPRFTALFTNLFKLAHDYPSRYLYAAALLPFLTAVSRTYGNYEAQETLLLSGRAKSGKSSFAKLMVPEEFRAGGNVAFQKDINKFLEPLGGALVGEVPELAGMTAERAELIKGLLSSTMFRTRFAFARGTTTQFPHYTLICTRNTNSAPLMLEEGFLRRFVVVEIEWRQNNGLNYFTKNLEQLWLEALYLYYEEGLRVPELFADDELYEMLMDSAVSVAIKDKQLVAEIGDYIIDASCKDKKLRLKDARVDTNAFLTDFNNIYTEQEKNRRAIPDYQFAAILARVFDIHVVRVHSAGYRWNYILNYQRFADIKEAWAEYDAKPTLPEPQTADELAEYINELGVEENNDEMG